MKSNCYLLGVALLVTGTMLVYTQASNDKANDK